MSAVLSDPFLQLRALGLAVDLEIDYAVPITQQFPCVEPQLVLFVVLLGLRGNDATASTPGCCQLGGHTEVLLDFREETPDIFGHDCGGFGNAVTSIIHSKGKSKKPYGKIFSGASEIE